MYGHGQKHVWLNGRKACSEVTRISWILAESRGEPDFDTSPVFGRNVGIELDIEPSLECSARDQQKGWHTSPRLLGTTTLSPTPAHAYTFRRNFPVRANELVMS